MEVVRFGGTVKKEGWERTRTAYDDDDDVTVSNTDIRERRGRRETTVYKARPGAGSVMIQITGLGKRVIPRLRESHLLAPSGRGWRVHTT